MFGSAWLTHVQVSAVQASLDVQMVCVPLPPYGAMELRYALMEVMRGTAVSVRSILTVADSCSTYSLCGYSSFFNVICIYSFLSKWSIPVQQFAVHSLLSPL